MRRPINVQVPVRRGESLERAIRRFSKKVKKEGIMDTILKRRFYEKPSTKRRKKKLRIKRIHEQNKKLDDDQKRG